MRICRVVSPTDRVKDGRAAADDGQRTGAARRRDHLRVHAALLWDQLLVVPELLPLRPMITLKDGIRSGLA